MMEFLEENGEFPPDIHYERVNFSEKLLFFCKPKMTEFLEENMEGTVEMQYKPNR